MASGVEAIDIAGIIIAIATLFFAIFRMKPKNKSKKVPDTERED